MTVSLPVGSSCFSSKDLGSQLSKAESVVREPRAGLGNAGGCNKNGEGLKTANIDREIRDFWAPPVWSLKLVRPMYDRSAYTFYQTIYP